VIERHKTDFVGIQKLFLLFLQQIKNVYGYFIPKINWKQGDVVLVHIEDWPSRADSPLVR
jgi:ribonuclease R